MNSLKRFRWILAFVLILSGLSLSSHAQQTTGSIAGTVKDESGAVVPAASVKATNVDTGFSRSAPSKRLRAVPHRLPARRQVHTSSWRRLALDASYKQNIALNVDQTQTVEITLSVGASTETVTVTSAPPLVNTIRRGIGQDH